MLNSPRSLEACKQLGILPKSLYFLDFKSYLKFNPEIIRLPPEMQKKRFDNINKFRKETINIVKQQRECIIELEQEKNEHNSKKKKGQGDINQTNSRKLQILNLEKMLNNIKIKEEKDIEKIKQNQKNAIFSQIEKKIKNKIIINKSDLKDQKVKMLHNQIKEFMQMKAENEEKRQKQNEINREIIFKQKIAKFEKENAKKHEGEERQQEKLKLESRKIQKEKHEMQKLKSEEYEERLKKSRIRVRENRERIIQSIEKKQKYTQLVFNKLLEARAEKLKEQKEKNDEKYKKMKERLKIANFEREKINHKSKERQERYEESAEARKLMRTNSVKERAQNQMHLFEMNQERKGKMREELVEKYLKIEKDMKEKEEKMEKGKQRKLYNLSVKQEDDYLKQYEKEQNIERLGRINIYKTEKRNEELLKKEKKMNDFKKRKNELIQSKQKLTDKMEKEKEKIISDFEKSFKNKEQLDAIKLIEDLFPEGKELSEKDMKLKERIEKLIEEMNKCSRKPVQEESENNCNIE